jgi:seryl-tRNA synthetase
MHDIKYIRENPEAFDAALRRRGHPPQSAIILAMDAETRGKKQKLEEVQAQANSANTAIGIAAKNGDTAMVMELKGKTVAFKLRLPELQNEARATSEKLRTLLVRLPNLPSDDVPNGVDENDNVELMRWGIPREFNFKPKDHTDLGLPLGLDFETAQKVSGARFAYLHGGLARLNRALGQFMLNRQTEVNGYKETATPYLVRDHAMFGTGQLPKFTEDQFLAADMSNRERLFWQAMPDDFEERMANTAKGEFRAALENMLSVAETAEQFWLIPTAEVSLTNTVREKLLNESDLPIRLTALTPCFRSEAGAAGKDTKGLIRQHQFEKVELVSITRPEDSTAEHERMVGHAESILKALELPYRKMLLCVGDMGNSARKTYDLEVWLPGQNLYREISSCSNCGDWQAQRMDARYRSAEGKGNVFVHTLNGSGLAVGRTLVAVLENYQEADGSVTVPDALLPYMGGITRLEPTG